MKSEWKSLSALKQISEDISSFGYSQEYISYSELDKSKCFHYGISSGRTVFFEYIEVNTSLWLNRSLIVRYVQKKTLSLCTVLKRIKYFKEETQHCPPSLYEIGNKLVTDVFEMTVLSHF